MCPTKSALAAILIALLACPSIHAQRSGMGIKAGLHISSFDSEVRRSNWLPGASLGAYAPIGLGARLELQPELLLTTLGASFELPEDKSYQVRTLYAQLPISVKWFMGDRFNLLAGFQTGFLLMAEMRLPEERMSVTSNYRTLDMGFNMGLGFDMPYGWDLGLRYYTGMTPVLRDDRTFFPKNRSLQFTAGYRLVQVKRSRTVRKRS